MKVQPFERAILDKKLKPVHLIFARGDQVKWFACKDTRPQKEYDLIVYDREGRALVLPTFPEEFEALNILPYPGGVTINGYIPWHDQTLDLNFNETDR